MNDLRSAFVDGFMQAMRDAKVALPYALVIGLVVAAVLEFVGAVP